VPASETDHQVDEHAADDDEATGRWFVADLAGWLILGGGVIVTVGSFLPWKIVGDPFKTRAMSGFESGGQHGLLTLVGGVALCIVGAAFVMDRETTITKGVTAFFSLAVLALGVGLLVVFAIDFRHLNPRDPLIGFEPTVSKHGVGLSSVAVGATMAMAGAVVLTITSLLHGVFGRRVH